MSIDNSNSIPSEKDLNLCKIRDRLKITKSVLTAMTRDYLVSS